MEYTRLLKKGKSGEDVLYIKKHLFDLKYFNSNITSISSKTYGNDTVVAVKRFQTNNVDLNGKKLEADGIIGPLTWQKIEALYFEKNNVSTSGLLKDYTHISAAKRSLIEKDLAGVSEMRKNIVLEILQYAYDADMGGDPKALYIFGANLYNTNKVKCIATEDYIKARAKALPSYFNGGRKEWMIEQVKKNPKIPASDCSGMEIGYMRKFGIASSDATANTLCTSSSWSTAVKKSNLKPGDWVGKSGHIGTYVGGGYVVEFYGGAYTCQITPLKSRKGYNFLRKKMVSGSAWTRFRCPKKY